MLRLNAYGYQFDDQWYSLEIPLVDFVDTGAKLEEIKAPFIFDGKRGDTNDLLLIEGVYFFNQSPQY